MKKGDIIAAKKIKKTLNLLRTQKKIVSLQTNLFDNNLEILGIKDNKQIKENKEDKKTKN